MKRLIVLTMALCLLVMPPAIAQTQPSEPTLSDFIPAGLRPVSASQVNGVPEVPEGSVMNIGGKLHQVQKGKLKSLQPSLASKAKAAAMVPVHKAAAGARAIGRGVVWIDERPPVQKFAHVCGTVGTICGAAFYANNAWTRIH